MRLGFLDLTAARGGAPMRWLDAVLAEEGEDAYLARVDWMGAQLVVQVAGIAGLRGERGLREQKKYTASKVTVQGVVAFLKRLLLSGGS